MPTLTPVASSPFASPLSTPTESQIPGAEVVSLLPTVTPTPWPTPTPSPIPTAIIFSTERELFTLAEVVEIYPMEEMGYDEIAMQGISYQEGDEPAPCPADGEITREGALPEGVTESESCLSIRLDDGRVVVFNDVEDAENTGRGARYEYGKALPEINYHLVVSTHWEWNRWILVDGENGEVTVLPANPHFAPDYRHFALAGRYFYLQLWRFDGTPHFEQGWSFEQLPWSWEFSAPVVRWQDGDTLQLYYGERAIEPPAEEVFNAVWEDDHWQPYLDGHALGFPLVDHHTIRFAIDGRGTRSMLDTLEVGKTLYTDQPYSFIALPPELEGATYFRIPQHFYLGEEPSYFPLEAQMANYLQFQVMQDAVVYVGLDAQVSSMPDWLQDGWQVAEIEVQSDDIPLQLYRKAYAAWEMVGLVDRWMTEGRVPSQFVVIVTGDE